jgi:sporulation protein YlmC with PRC-barrel domain
MPELSDFRLGADVVGSDGQKAGTLASVLVEGKGFDPQALVIKEEESLTGRLVADEKFYVTDEVVIPIASVDSATHDLIRLSIPAADVSKQPPYLSYRFKRLTLGTAALEEAEMLGGLGTPNVEEVANKQEGQIEIDRDENVMLGTTGRRLGKVQDLLYHDGELIGVVIRPEGFFKKDVVLPIRFVSRADDLALFADLDESAIRHLEPFAGAE